MVKPNPLTFLTGMVSTPLPIVSAEIRISATAKIPIRVVSVLKPAIRSLLPKVNLRVPSIGAMPTMANTRPSMPASKPLTMLPELRIATMVSAKKQIPKFSIGVNCSAISASFGAKKARIINEKMEPRKENTMPMPSARIASPFWAIG